MQKIARLAQNIWSIARANAYYSAGIVLVVLVAAGTMAHVSRKTEPGTSAKAPRDVSVAVVADLMDGGSVISVVGEIQSRNEAKISAEASGRITRVNASLGSTVAAGTLLAEIENSSQRAVLLQAEGALDAAKASVPNLASTLESAKGSAVNTLLGAYAAVESAVRDSIDPLFINPEFNSTPSIIITSTDSQATRTLENTRAHLSEILKRQKSKATNITKSDDLQAELAITEAEVRDTRNFIETLIKALGAGVPTGDISPSELLAYKASASAARTSLTVSLSSISSAKNALEIAVNNTSASDAPSSQEASLKQAQGAYSAALANLEKTRIRAPIYGTLNNFEIKLGDNVSPGQPLAVISNNGALEVVAFITETDRANIEIGGAAIIEGGYIGTISKIAPALDPTTRKIEVRIAPPSNAMTKLINGGYVRVELKHSNRKAESGRIELPIAAVKMETDRNVVFAVSSSTLIALPVTVGPLSGDYIEILDGLTLENAIVTDARGLKEGDVVKVGL